MRHHKFSYIKRVHKALEYILNQTIDFADKLMYILNRYHELTKEMINRGYNANPVPYKDLIKGIDKSFFGDYTPTEHAMKINRERIEQRLGGF